MKRIFLAPVLAAAAIMTSAPAWAQSDWLNNDRVSYADDRQSYYDSRRAAYDNGFREGLKEGEKDGRKNDVFRYEDEKAFQRADKGYHREYGALDRYRQSFRSGYAAGYSDGYQRYAPSYSRNGGSFPRRDTRTYPNSGRYPTYPGYPDTRYPDTRYPDTRYPSGGVYGGGYSNVAFQNGVQDGIEKGAEDARKNRSFDPLRHGWYRDGDRHYEGRYGTREQYKDLYRQGFQQGYDRGYREGGYQRW